MDHRQRHILRRPRSRAFQKGFFRDAVREFGATIRIRQPERFFIVNVRRRPANPDVVEAAGAMRL